MKKGTPKSPPPKKTAEVPAPSGVAVVAWGLVLAAGCRAVQLVLEAQAMAASVGQAVLVEWGASRLGVVWTDPAKPTTTAQIARRAGIGAAIGIALGALVFGIGLATHGLRVEHVTQVEASVLAIGLASAAIQAWRDELLLHGIALRALSGTPVSPAARVVACGITSAGAALGRGDATPRTVFVAVLLGIVFGALWVNDRGAWQPWAAHTASRWTVSTLLSGGLLSANVADNAWAGGSAGMLGGTAAVVALAPIAVLAVGWTARRGISPLSAGVG